MIQIMEFDNWYREQGVFEFEAAEWIDFTGLSGTNGYCDDEAAEEISRKSAAYRRQERTVTWIGNGNYHYVSHLLSMHVKQPFSLVVFDHHPDMQPSFFAELLSCGSWVLHALERNPFLQQAVLIGVKDELLDAVGKESERGAVREGSLWHFQSHGRKVTAVAESYFQKKAHSEEELIKQLEAWIDTPVYLSIDKDVLCAEDCMTNWDSGSMRLSELLVLAEALIKRYSIVGIDLCGEAGDSRESGALENNRRCNQQILQMLKGVCYV